MAQLAAENGFPVSENIRESVGDAVGTVDGWGRFAPAIERWEKISGNEAPSPTEADGKNGTHRLSPKFTEWMMGLPSGHITGHGIGRREELRACGNGVVPQQALFALRIIFDRLG